MLFICDGAKLRAADEELENVPDTKKEAPVDPASVEAMDIDKKPQVIYAHLWRVCKACHKLLTALLQGLLSPFRLHVRSFFCT